MRIGFDNEKYVQLQSQQIRKRIDQFGGKLYLEFGGKLYDDYHASRVLPGFKPDSKMQMLRQLKDDVEILIAINAGDIEKNKVRGDLGISYDEDVLRLIDVFRGLDLYVSGVVVTRCEGQPAADAFIHRLQTLGVRCWKHYTIAGYPYDIKTIVSDDGFGKNEYIETTRSLVVVTAPGPGSGKLATCLSQVYHEYKRGIKAGYAKFETFPIWNLAIEHPVNLAYEAATADLSDVNISDHFHHDAYDIDAVNYNRDMEAFPVLSAMFQRILGACPYKSPTDMGVNMAGFCIVDDEVTCQASRMEILRRYYAAMADRVKGVCSDEIVQKLELLMIRAGISSDLCPAWDAALQKAEETGAPAAAMVLEDGRVITGKTTALLGASSSLLINALKALGEIPDEIDLISPEIIEPVTRLKTGYLGSKNPRLHSDEVLIALSICAVTDPNAQTAIDQLNRLSGCDAFFSVIISSEDERLYRALGMNVSCQPRYETRKLYHK